MKLPNILTLFRIILIPVMIICVYIDILKYYIVADLSYRYLACLVIFVVASITDFLDGFIARKYNMVTTFGKFADPLADKMLVFSAMTILVRDNLIPVWVFVVMIIREFMVSGIRMLAAERGEVISAGLLGKLKTAVTMVAIIVMFLSGLHNVVYYVGQGLLYAACLLTIVSGVQYFWKSRKIIFESI